MKHKGTGNSRGFSVAHKAAAVATGHILWTLQVGPVSVLQSHLCGTEDNADLSWSHALFTSLSKEASHLTSVLKQALRSVLLATKLAEKAVVVWLIGDRKNSFSHPGQHAEQPVENERHHLTAAWWVYGLDCSQFSSSPAGAVITAPAHKRLWLTSFSHCEWKAPRINTFSDVYTPVGY